MSIEERYTDFYGRVRDVPERTKKAILNALGPSGDEAPRSLRPVYLSATQIPADAELYAEDGKPVTAREGLAPGYYRVEKAGESALLIRAPHRAYVPPALERAKQWGIAAQLYSLRSQSNWGIGDYSDLAQLARMGSESGAAAIGVNPLHELHLTNASSASPYSPASRLHLNILYIDVPEAARYVGVALTIDPERRAEIERLRAAPLVAYVEVAKLKLSALREVYEAFLRGSARGSDFAEFRAAGGERLRRFALYEALMERFAAEQPHTYGWMQWPEAYRDCNAPAVREFAEANSRSVGFYEFAQWIADVQLGAAARASEQLGVGLYRDLAVGVDANSADVWADPGAFCLELSVGAPPDPLNTAGQDWSLPPLNPFALREHGYAPYIALLRANMRHAGALRIDHVMGLMRLFCIPRGEPASDGAYLKYPFDEMLAVLALESHRNRCMVVGEDLGTVPPGFRERIAEMQIFGCRLLYFEREQDGSFRIPEAYTTDAVASTGTHDLPPLAGYWNGSDIETRCALGMHAAAGEREREFAERDTAKQKLLEMLRSRGDLGTVKAAGDMFAVVLAAYRMLGRSAARLLLLQIEDIVLQQEQVNTPGTFDEVPNWRRKISLEIERIADDPRFVQLAAALRETRAEGGAR